MRPTISKRTAALTPFGPPPHFFFRALYLTPPPAGARTASGIAGRYFEAQLGRPSLVRESSRRSLAQSVRAPVETVRSILAGQATKDPANALSGVILHPKLDARLRLLSVRVSALLSGLSAREGGAWGMPVTNTNSNLA